MLNGPDLRAVINGQLEVDPFLLAPDYLPCAPSSRKRDASGYKESGIGRECGEAALENYTETKAVFFNMGVDAPQ